MTAERSGEGQPEEGTAARRRLEAPDVTTVRPGVAPGDREAEPGAARGVGRGRRPGGPDARRSAPDRPPALPGPSRSRRRRPTPSRPMHRHLHPARPDRRPGRRCRRGCATMPASCSGSAERGRPGPGQRQAYGRVGQPDALQLLGRPPRPAPYGPGAGPAPRRRDGRRPAGRATSRPVRSASRTTERLQPLPLLRRQGRPGVQQRLGRGPHPGHRRPQLVGRVGQELPAPLLRPAGPGLGPFELVEHLVQRLRGLADLGVGPVGPQPFAPLPGGDPPGQSGDLRRGGGGTSRTITATSTALTSSAASDADDQHPAQPDPGARRPGWCRRRRSGWHRRPGRCR